MTLFSCSVIHNSFVIFHFFNARLKCKRNLTAKLAKYGLFYVDGWFVNYVDGCQVNCLFLSEAISQKIVAIKLSNGAGGELSAHLILRL